MFQNGWMFGYLPNSPFPQQLWNLFWFVITPSPGAGKESVSSVCHVPLCTKSTHGHSIERRLRRVTKVFMRKLQACRSIPSLKYKKYWSWCPWTYHFPQGNTFWAYRCAQINTNISFVQFKYIFQFHKVKLKRVHWIVLKPEHSWLLKAGRLRRWTEDLRSRLDPSNAQSLPGSVSLYFTNWNRRKQSNNPPWQSQTNR